MAEIDDDSAPLTHTEQAMLYAGGDMSPDEQVEFEKHLATCAECQQDVAQAQKVLPVAMAHLAFKPKRTVEEQVARFDAMRTAKLKRDARRRLGIAAAVVLAIAAAVGAWVAWWPMAQTTSAPQPVKPHNMSAPTR